MASDFHSNDGLESELKKTFGHTTTVNNFCCLGSVSNILTSNLSYVKLS
jgi:hypothetical protein